MKCYNCDREIPEEALFCPYCGSDQRSQNCSFCGEALLLGSSFCLKCGEKVDGREPYRPRRFKEKSSKCNENVLRWIKFSLSTFFCLLMLVFLFLPIGRTSMRKMIGLPLDIEITYNTFDAFKGLSYLSDESTTQEYMKYIDDICKEYMSDDLYSGINSVSDLDNLSKSEIRQIKRAFNHINAFSIFMIPEVRDTTKFTIVAYIILVALYITLMVVCVASLGLSIYNLVRKQDNKLLNIIHNILLTVALFSFIYISYFNKTTNYKMTSGPILFLIFGLLSYLIFIIFDIIKSRKRIPFLWVIKKGINIAFAILVLLMINLRLIRYEYTYMDVDGHSNATITDYESIHKLSAYFNKILDPNFNPQKDDTYFSQLASLLRFNSKKINKIYLDALWDSSLTFSINDMQIFNPDIFLPILFGLHLVSVFLLGMIIRKNIVDIRLVEDRSKKETLILGIILLLFIAALAVGTYFMVYALNDSYDFLKLKHEASLDVGIYFSFAFMVCFFVWNLVFPTRLEQFQKKYN